jgi:hypothetical protein
MSTPATAVGYARLLRLVTAPRAAWHIAALAFVLTLPAASMGLVADDYTLLRQAAQQPLDAFEFQSRDPALRQAELRAARARGDVPWWTDLQSHAAFLRPLASLSHALDAALWPRAAWWMHVENALLYAALVLLAGALYRALALPAVSAGLATFFYAVNGNQSMSAGWISGRNTLLAAVFGLLSFWLHVCAHAREPEGRAGRFHIGAASAFICSLLSAEAGLASLAYLIAHACVLDRGALPARLARLWPYAVVAVAWRAGYQWAGYGNAYGGFYHDPGEQPAAFALGVLTAIPIYLASQLTMPFASASASAPHAVALLTGVSLVLLTATRTLWLPPLRADRRARFLGLGALLSVIPLGATVPQDRLVFFVGFGMCGLVAQIIEQRFSPDNLAQSRSGARRLYYLHALLAPLAFVPWLFGCMSAVAGGGGIALERALPEASTRGVVLINAPSQLAVPFQRDIRQWRGAASVPFVDLLYAGGAPVEVQRTSARTLELSVARGYFATPLELGRDARAHPLRRGEVIKLPRMRVTVLAVSQGAPTRVRFEFQNDLSSGELLVYAWQGRTPRPWSPPEPGSRTVLPAIAPL